MSALLPMLASAGNPPVGEGWTVEIKWDGGRALVTVTDDGVVVTNRLGGDITNLYPELRILARLVPVGTILDGEIVAVTPGGRPSFARLQDRMGHYPTPDLLTEIPVSFYVFDILSTGSDMLIRRPYRERRAVLDALTLDMGEGGTIRVPASHVDVPGSTLLGIARDYGLEGIVAKRLDSRYELGHRSAAWVKTALLTTREVVVAGWIPGKGQRRDSLGSLLVGAHVEGSSLRYVGSVGVGFTDRELMGLRARVESLVRSRCPFEVTTGMSKEYWRHARWVEPVLVGEVECRHRDIREGLRHPVWRGLRDDKLPTDVRINE